MTSKTLRKQQETKNDECYTQYTDIEKDVEENVKAELLDFLFK